MVVWFDPSTERPEIHRLDSLVDSIEVDSVSSVRGLDQDQGPLSDHETLPLPFPDVGGP